MLLEVIDHHALAPVSKEFLRNFLRFAEKSLKAKNILPTKGRKKLTIAFVSAKSIRRLNKVFRNKDRATDILSFSPVEKDSFGEIALCVAKIESQARRDQLSIEEETAYLILHGFLHLLGYQHERGRKSARIMYQIQDDIFEKWKNLHKL